MMETDAKLYSRESLYFTKTIADFCQVNTGAKTAELAGILELDLIFTLLNIRVIAA